MISQLSRYYHWLHGQWPAGKVESLPVVGEDGETNVSGIRIVGDLSGVPLLKFSSETGTKAVHAFLAESDFDGQRSSKEEGVVDIAIIGGGVSGVSAAIEAKRAGLAYTLFETSELFSTVSNFPRKKPIYTYPVDMTPSGGIQYGEKSGIKEGLLEEMEAQVTANEIAHTKMRIDRVERKGSSFILHHGDGSTSRALRVIIAIGRSGNFRKLGVPGEQLDKVANRLHDPKDFCGSNVLVVGGGDSAMETAIALAECGSHVTLSYRGKELSRPKPENVEKVQALAKETPSDGTMTLALGSTIGSISEKEAVIKTGDKEETIANDFVFALIGREAPLDFFRRSGVTVSGDRNKTWWFTFALALLVAFFVYEWKKPGTWTGIGSAWQNAGLFPYNIPGWWEGLGGAFADPTTLLGVLKVSVGEAGFYYSVLYCLLMVVFGIRRINRRRTQYVKVQTLTLISVQLIPLFLLPYILLPLMGNNGWFDAGAGKWFADEFFPAVTYTEHGREYWRAFGFILAWPLFIWNVFSDQPLWGWLIVSLIQTFVIIPIIVRRWGKGAYCGWVCSCGGMAETLGDAHRHKMPHGPIWNRLNMIGQVFLAFAFLVLILRAVGWFVGPVGEVSKFFLNWKNPVGYAWFVDLLFAGIIGFGLYFHFSGRVWCRFACPLAALMHIYARFSQFRIFPEKKKCISCNVCTSVCHQGIDIMNFANKGIPMSDPECVRCSACVQQCPTGVLSFGRFEAGEKITLDKLSATRVND